MKAKLLSLLVLSIVLISCVSATIIVKGYFSDNVNNNDATITEGDSITLKAIFSSTDSITQKSVQLPSGLSSDGGQCTFSGHTYTCIYSITGNSEGDYSIKIIGKDSDKSIDNDYVTLTVEPKNTPADTTKPIIKLNGNNPTSVYVGHSYTDAGATAEDNIDGDITSKIHVTNTVNTNSVGSYSVIYTVSDEAGNTATKIRTVNVIASPIPTNHAPVIESISNDEIDEGDGYSYQIEASDEDGDDLTYELEGPSWLYITTNGLVYGTADSVSSDKEYSITITVSDGELSDSENYILTVKDTSSNEDKPTINVVSPVEDKKYTKDLITFKVETNGEAVKFKLDKEEIEYMDYEDDSGDEDYPNVFTYTTTLSNGSHKIKFYAINEYGETTETVEFSVKEGGSSSGCSSGYTVTDYSSTTNAEIDTSVKGVSTIIANKTTGTKNTDSLLILFYLLLGIVGFGTLITGYALIKRVGNRGN